MGRNNKSIHKEYKKRQGKQLYEQFEEVKKREKEIGKRSIMERMSGKLNIPTDILAGAPILMATGKNQVCLENYKGIIEYNGNLIRVQTKICKISIEGKNLNIDYFTEDELRISGIIQSIKYI